MGLDEIVRDAVALADSLTQDLQRAVTHSAFSDQASDGAVTYAAPVSRKAVVEFKEQLVQGVGGQLQASRCHVVFARPVALDVRDKIVLPDGSTGPILRLAGVVDGGTGGRFYTEIWLGDLVSA